MTPDPERKSLVVSGILRKNWRRLLLEIKNEISPESCGERAFYRPPYSCDGSSS
jgi:hypothetical protein